MCSHHPGTVWRKGLVVPFYLFIVVLLNSTRTRGPGVEARSRLHPKCLLQGISSDSYMQHEALACLTRSFPSPARLSEGDTPRIVHCGYVTGTQGACRAAASRDGDVTSGGDSAAHEGFTTCDVARLLIILHADVETKELSSLRVFRFSKCHLPGGDTRGGEIPLVRRVEGIGGRHA